jgi:hypothetical protein
MWGTNTCFGPLQPSCRLHVLADLSPAFNKQEAGHSISKENRTPLPGTELRPTVLWPKNQTFVFSSVYSAAAGSHIFLYSGLFNSLFNNALVRLHIEECYG